MVQCGGECLFIYYFVRGGSMVVSGVYGLLERGNVNPVKYNILINMYGKPFKFLFWEEKYYYYKVETWAAFTDVIEIFLHAFISTKFYLNNI